MAGDAMKKVQPGDRLAIPAETFNCFIDAAQDFRARQQSRGGQSMPTFQNSDVVLVKNSSGANRDRFDVLAIGGVLFGPTDNLDEFRNRPTLVGTTPDARQHVGRFAILLEPVANGAIGRAAIGGLCVARVSVADDSFWYPRADIEDGQHAALVGTQHGPAQILWRASGTGPQWAVVRLGCPPAPRMVWFRLKESYYPSDGFAENNHTRAAYAYGEDTLDMDPSNKLMPIDVRFPMGDVFGTRRWLAVGADDVWSAAVDASHGLAVCDATGIYRVASIWPQRRTAKVQGGESGWTANVNGWQDVSVPVKLAPGGVEVGSEFSAYLRVPHGKASAIYPGGAGAGLVEIAVDADGKVRIVSPATDRFIGAIEMFSGTAAPRGWRLCDGENGTPDLRGRFIVGTGQYSQFVAYSVGSTGGYVWHGHASEPYSENNHADHASHGHILEYGEFGEQYYEPGSHPIYGPIGVVEATLGPHSLTDNRPPYYALAFIMRVADVT